MPSDSGDRRSVVAKTQNMGAGGTLPPPPPEQEQLPCPRCESMNTKFCYYNNYNLSQPRHFCKSCRRYWTQGGTLRNIPIGGGIRKNAKRSRTSSASSQEPVSVTPISFSPPPVDSNDMSSLSLRAGVDFDVNVNVSGSFSSLLNTQGPGGFLGLGGFGLGLGTGFDEMGFGVGQRVWPLTDIIGDGVGGSGDDSGGNNPWQLGSGEGTFVDNGDCGFTWPELAISMPGKGQK